MRRLFRSLSIVLAAAVASTGAAYATPVTGPSASAESAQRAVLTLKINGLDCGQVFVALRGDDVLVKMSDLTDHGVRGEAGTQIHLPYGDYVSLSSLMPKVSFSVDTENLSLSLTILAENLEGATVDVGNANRAQPIQRVRRSAFLNYAVTAGPKAPPSIVGEFGATVGRGFFRSAFSRGAFGFSQAQTSYTIDDPAHLRRLIVGDAYADASAYDPLGGGAEIVGATVTRQYNMNPNSIRSGIAGITGMVQTPTDALIYVNGILQSQSTLPPGSFSLTNLPLADGSNNVQVVLRDAFGRIQTIDRSFFHSSTLLGPGFTDYSYGVGVPSAGYWGGGYTTPSALGRYALGLRHDSMIAGRLEMTKGMVSGGVGLDHALPFGLVHAGIGMSRTPQGGGSAVDISLTAGNRRLVFSAEMLRRSAAYANLQLTPQQNRNRVEDAFAVTTTVGQQAISLNYLSVVPRDAPSTLIGIPTYLSAADVARRDISLNDGFSIGRFGGVSIGVGRSITNGRRSPLFTVSFNTSSINGPGVFVSKEQRDGQRYDTVSLQKPVPQGQGIGYQLQSTNFNGTSIRTLNLEYHGAKADVLVNGYQGAASGFTATVSGAVGIVNDHVFLARPIDGSFAVIDVGAPNVTTYLNNQRVGKSDRNGLVIAPNLFSYQANEISVASDDAPANVLIEDTKRFVVPGYRTGTAVSFGARRIAAFTGQLLVQRSGKSGPPAYGEIVLNADKIIARSDIGADGAFYLENVQPGTYAAIIRYAAGTCQFSVTIPSTNKIVSPLGTLTCNAH